MISDNLKAKHGSMYLLQNIKMIIHKVLAMLNQVTV